MTIKRIVVPTDFSEPADEALDYAFDLARAVGATVSLAHVLGDPFDGTIYSENRAPMPPEIREELLADIRRRLADRAARGGRSDVSSAILTGPTAPAIVDNARHQKADLIVMGTRGSHETTHLLMGSVAERVVQTAACPVLTVRGASTRSAEPGLHDAAAISANPSRKEGIRGRATIR
jgi:nucleotide-binding universal stress UspA family protein